MKSIILLVLFLILASPIDLSCQSSCLTCSGPYSTDCLSCDSSILMLNTNGVLNTCIGLPNYTTVLAAIDLTWTNLNRYIYSFSTITGEYAIDVGHTLTLSNDIGGNNYYGFNFAGVPANHYMI